MAIFSIHNVNLHTETLSVGLGTAGTAWGDLQGGPKFPSETPAAISRTINCEGG